MYTPIKLDKVRNFRYGMKAMSNIEKTFEKNLKDIDFENLTIEETATVFCIGLQHEDPELTAEKVMDLIDEHSNIAKVAEAMAAALADAFGPDETGADDQKNQ